MNPYEYINSFSRFGLKGGYNPGLERISALLKPFDHPENKVNIIHIAGSNGKGSTLTYLKYIYQEAGYRVGAYTSPHLFNLNERLEVNGRKISTAELRELCQRIKPVIDKTEKSPAGKPGFFEVLTALAFIYFEQQGVDLALVETGLGGRFDATSIVKSPLLSIITGISLEHTSILGNTIGEIAREKAGIIKEGKSVITAVRKQRALKVISEIAEARSAELKSVDALYQIKLKASSLEGQYFQLVYKENRPEANKLVEGEYFIKLPGKHQLRNVMAALAAVEELQPGYPLSFNIIKRGLEKAYISGRLELVKTDPLFIFDGAHNPEGMKCLVSFLKEQLKPDTELQLVLSVLGDKNIKEMLRQLKGLQSDFNLELVITSNGNPRALDADMINKIKGIEKFSHRLILEI